MSKPLLEAVIVCRDYADFLGQTLPHNLAHFDRIVVVTSPRERRTLPKREGDDGLGRFVTLRAAKAGEVFRGVSFAPEDR